MAAKNTWLNPEQAASSNDIDWYKVKWSHPQDTVTFQHCSNRQIHRCLSKRNPSSLILPSFLHINGLPLQINLHREHGLIEHLASSTKDLLYSLQRNGLSLGINRAPVGEPAQICCPYCPYFIESAKPFFGNATMLETSGQFFASRGGPQRLTSSYGPKWLEEQERCYKRTGVGSQNAFRR